jgi:hypothetical protein
VPSRRTRLELDQRRHRLAGLGGFGQRLDDRGIGRGPVQRLLDGDDVRVARGLLQEVHHHVERFERVVDDEILLPDRREAIAAVIADAVGIARRVGNEFEVRPVEARDLRHFVQRQHAVDVEHAGLAGIERALHEALQFRRHPRLDVEPDHDATAAALERGLEQPHQVFGLFEDFHLRVADHPERARAFHRIAGKKLADEQAGRALDRDQPGLPGLPAVGGLGQPDETLDAVRHADQRVHRLAVLAAGKLQGDGEAEIGDERERMGRIDCERRQQRKDVGQEVVLEPDLLGLGHIRRVDQHDAGLGERPAQFAPLRLLVLDQERNRLADMDELFGGRHTLGALADDAGTHLRAETGNAHHEEFVEVIGRNRQEFEPLQQRLAAVGRFLEHTAVEVQPRQFAIDEAVGARGKPGIGRSRGLLRPPGCGGF